MTRTLWLCVVAFVSAVILALDIVTDSHIRVQILFVIPVGVAAWHLSRGAGIVAAIVLVGCRFVIAITLERYVDPVWAAAVNASIRMALLIALAMLVSAEREKRALAQRVQLLEGILPICMFCKKIRGPDGEWEQIESYITKHSAAHFSHGCCEECGREQYGEYFPAPVSKDAKPGQ